MDPAMVPEYRRWAATKVMELRRIMRGLDQLDQLELTVKDVEASFANSFVDFVCILAGADGDLDYEEVALLNQFFGRLSFEETYRLVGEVMAGVDVAQVVQTVPDFIKACAWADVQLQSPPGASLSHTVIEVFRICGELILDADGKESEAERAFLEAYIAVLECYPEAVQQHFASLSAQDDHGEQEARDGSSASVAERSVAATDMVQESVEALLLELGSLIGLEKVKSEVTSLINLVRVRQMREAQGLPVPPMSLHVVFTGNPGTGKTTVARLLGRIYRALGLLSSGHLVEVDRSGLVAGYVGQTALKTQEVLSKAKGGILFIDEAYSLATGNELDYGREAIDTLLKAMEDLREDLVVIVAGYPSPMEEFLDSNPGLRSRFNKHIYFEDYTSQELMQIFEVMCRESGYVPSIEAKAHASMVFDARVQFRDTAFGNAREVRNFLETCISRHANRIVQLSSPTRLDMVTLTLEDMPV